MSILEAGILIGAGILVGFINTLAGGGSVISLSVLMFMGLPANVANGTNRIGILMQNIVAVRNFHVKKALDWKKGSWLAAPAVIGAIAGSQLASDLNEILLERIIGALLLVVLFLMVYKPERWLKEKTELVSKKISFWQILIFLAIGFYGGFIQAGVGFFLLSGLVLSAGYELVKANGIKNLIVLFYTPFALVIFILNKDVNFFYGIVLALGNMLGAYLASSFAIEWGARFVRWVVLLVILLTSLKLFGIINIDLFSQG